HEGLNSIGAAIAPQVAPSRRRLRPGSTSTDEGGRLGTAPSAPPLPAEGRVSGPESASVRQGAVLMGLSEVTATAARRAKGPGHRRNPQRDITKADYSMTEAIKTGIHATSEQSIDTDDDVASDASIQRSFRRPSGDDDRNQRTSVEAQTFRKRA